MFIYYHGTKADFEKKNLAEIYSKDIVFIKGGSNGKGECIFTRGNFFGNFEELIGTLNFVKGAAIKITDPETGSSQWSLLDAASGGGYIALDTATPYYINVGSGSTGIEISLTEQFLNDLKTIEKDLEDLGDRLETLENKLNPDYEGNILDTLYNTIVGNVSQDYNTLEKLEGKIKSLLSKLKSGNGLDLVTDTETGTVTANVLVDETSISINNSNKLSVKTVDGGNY